VVGQEQGSRVAGPRSGPVCAVDRGGEDGVVCLHAALEQGVAHGVAESKYWYSDG
jgi:hypothetical protein